MLLKKAGPDVLTLKRKPHTFFTHFVCMHSEPGSHQETLRSGRPLRFPKSAHEPHLIRAAREHNPNAQALARPKRLLQTREPAKMSQDSQKDEDDLRRRQSVSEEAAIVPQNDHSRFQLLPWQNHQYRRLSTPVCNTEIAYVTETWTAKIVLAKVPPSFRFAPSYSREIFWTAPSSSDDNSQLF